MPRVSVDSLVIVPSRQFSAGLPLNGILSMAPLFSGKFGLNCSQTAHVRKPDIIYEISGSHGGAY
jgi:hypothetical protein